MYRLDLEDIFERPEFTAYAPREDKAVEKLNEAVDFLNGEVKLSLMPYQEIVGNFMSPDSPFDRLMLKWAPGVGKTLGVINIAMNNIRIQRLNEKPAPVYILGFSETIFRAELMRFPEFGFVTTGELDELNWIKSHPITPESLKKKTELESKIKRRMTNGKENGLFKFIGYQALVFKLFKINDVTLKTSIMDQLNPDTILRYIDEGKITVNTEFLESFQNSLVIADEVHITYNTQKENNWGFSILYILKKVKCKFIGLTGTPINNNPAEIIFILNLLGHYDVKKSDIFKQESGKWKLQPGGLEKIAELCKGRFSFVQDTDTRRFPSREFIGEPLPKTPYLKFIRCPIDGFYKKNYLELIRKSDNLAIEQENQNIMDFCLPGPDNKPIFTSVDIAKLEFEKKEYKQKSGIEVKKGVIHGPICDSENLKKYAPKYYHMIKSVLEFIKTPQKMLIYHKNIRSSGVLFIEEILIRHGFINEDATPGSDTLCYNCREPLNKHDKTGAGVDSDRNFEYVDFDDVMFFDGAMLGSMPDDEKQFADFKKLTKNKPVILETGNPKLVSLLTGNDFEVFADDSGVVKLISNIENDKAIGMFDLGYENIKNYVSGSELKSGAGTKKACSEFVPIRYTLLHGEMDKNKLVSTMEKFNAVSNKLGKYIMIAVGSKKIGQGYNFKEIQKLFVMNRPDNISILKQIIGRGARNMSHVNLEPEMRHLKIYLYTITLGKSEYSYDEIKYMEKIQDYLTIQKIEKVIHENTIDPFVIATNDDFEMLPYTKSIKIKPGKLTYSSFDAYYSRSVINQMIYLIKRLFIEISPIYTYKDLYAMVCNPPDLEGISYFDFGAASEDLFVVALDIIINNNKNNSTSLFDPAQRIITDGKFRGMITKKDKYFCLVQIDEKGNEIIYPDSFFRISKSESITRIDVSAIIKNIESLYNYEDRKEVFYNKWTGINVMDMESALCDNNSKFHEKLIEEIIEYIFGIITKKRSKSKYHEFYFKMIYYYNIRDIIIWPHTTKDFISEMYTKYYKEPENEFIANVKGAISKATGDADLSTGNLINILKTSFNNSIIKWYPDEAYLFYKKLLDKTLKVYDDILEKSFRKIPSNMLPIGYCISKNPRFYHPDKRWFDVPDYFETSAYIENDIIIGYDLRVEDSMQNRFKLRTPVQFIKKEKDRRKLEIGSTCVASKSKSFIFGLLKKLKIDYEANQNIVSLCSLIRTKLILNEITERQKKSKIKWFYSAWERQPK